tara:strand:- start:215 stop:1045 length:831 start_codon:yes stop_codon:yes gene_type:complete
MTVIVGAGAFSHAHIRCLLELDINTCTIAKLTTWKQIQKQKFIDTHPSMNFVFNNDPDLSQQQVHIVSPSNTHADMLKKYASAKTIFVEKPSVLYNNDNDFINANQCVGKIYQNDWLSQIQQYRKNKGRPENIIFTYYVKNSNKIDHITELWSHAINLLSIWYDPTCKIHINQIKYKKRSSLINVIIDEQTSLSIHTSNGLSDTSHWKLRIDDEEFSNQQMGGQLLINTLNTMLTDKDPLTNWYKSSWMIHRFRLLQCEELFKTHYHLYYRRQNGY